jgi:hypothetical protein
MHRRGLGELLNILETSRDLNHVISKAHPMNIQLIPFDAGASLASVQRQDHSTRVSSSKNSMLTVAADFEIRLHSVLEFTFGGTLEPMPNFTL